MNTLLSKAFKAGLKVNADESYILGYGDGLDNRPPDSRQAFYAKDYIEGYADAWAERDNACMCIRAHELGLHEVVGIGHIPTPQGLIDLSEGWA